MYVLLFIVVAFVLCCGRYRVSQNLYENALSKKFGEYIFVAFLFIVTLSRYNVGHDYHTYYEYLTGNSIWAEQFFEPIPRYVLILAKLLSSPFLFFAIMNSLILIFVLKAIHEESDNEFESLCIFLTLFYLETLSTVRQWLGVAFVFYGFRYIRQRKFFHYLVMVILATMCHYSAILSISIYFIYNYINAKISIILCIGSMIFGNRILSILLSFPFLSSYSHYFEVLFIQGGTKSILIWYMMFVFSLLIYLKVKNRKDIEKLFSVVCYSIIFPILLGPSIGRRLSDYFTVYYIYLLPLCFNKIKAYGLRRFFMLPFYMYHTMFLIVDSRNDRGFADWTWYFLKDGLSSLTTWGGVRKYSVNNKKRGAFYA